MAEIHYDYTSRHWSSKKERVPNEKLPPFFANTQVKVNGKNEVWPLYIPFDATDKTQGVVWLTDDLVDKKTNSVLGAKRGMTAITPQGVKDNTLWTTKNESGVKTSSDDIVFKGNVTFAKPINGGSSDKPGITAFSVRIANANLPSSDNSYIIGTGDLDVDTVTVPIRVFPLDMIPTLTEDKLPSNISGNKITDGSITGDKVADGTLSYNKLSSEAKSNIDSSIDAKVNAIPRNMYIQFSDGDVTSDVKTLTLGSTTTITASINAIPEGQVSSLFTPRS
mgnify:CR=1 FL=1|jgi:hypothetical protein|nr:MAG TPA_asm: hypothetical protein [Caudoviricetes sp.]